MEIVADSGAIYGLYDKSDSTHAAVRRAIENERGKIIIPSVILGEIDYFLRMRMGTRALVQFLVDVSSGAFQVEDVTAGDLAECRKLLMKYDDLDLGLCDASVIAVANRLRITRILTVDERDFRVVRSREGKPFTLLPADLAAGKRRG